MKGEAKKKSAKINASRNKTGGGISIEAPLNSIDETIIGIIGKVPIDGDSQITESVANFDFNAPSTSKA